MHASLPLSSRDREAFAVSSARKSLLAFCAYSDPYFVIQPHHRLIADAFERIADGSLKRLRIEMPPRSGKSRLTQEFIAWYLGHFPFNDVIYSGHSVGLLQGFSRNIRNRVQSDRYKKCFDTSIASDSSAVNNWNVENGGEFAIFGVGGGITGKGFHLGIIDDPYASREDAESDTIRAKTLDWYNSTFYSRRQSENAAIVLIMQRWREDDLAGQIEEQDGDEWEVIKIPAISEDGQSFWPDKFSVEDLMDVRKKLGDYFFESQYQQNPVDLAGGAFRTEMFQYYTQEELEASDLSKFRLYTALDPAIGQKETNDYAAITTIAVNPRSNDIYVLESIRGRWLPDEIITQLFAAVRRWGVRHVGVEAVQYQKMLILEIRKQMRIRDQFFVLDEIMPMGEKNARMKSVLQPRYSNRSVLHPRSGVEEMELELLKFPNGKHDDMMDSLSMAVSMASAANVGREPPKERTFHDKMLGRPTTQGSADRRAMFGLGGGDPSSKRFL